MSTFSTETEEMLVAKDYADTLELPFGPFERGERGLIYTPTFIWRGRCLRTGPLVTEFDDVYIDCDTGSHDETIEMKTGDRASWGNVMVRIPHIAVVAGVVFPDKGEEPPPEAKGEPIYPVQVGEVAIIFTTTFIWRGICQAAGPLSLVLGRSPHRVDSDADLDEINDPYIDYETGPQEAAIAVNPTSIKEGERFVWPRCLVRIPYSAICAALIIGKAGQRDDGSFAISVANAAAKAKAKRGGKRGAVRK